MQFARSLRLTALATGLVVAAGTFSTVPAQAHTSGKTYKAGAIALGVVGAYYLSKGKTVEGAAAIGGGYLAYKKGQKVANQERYGRTDYPRYGSNGNYGQGAYNQGGYGSDVYPDSGTGYNNRNQSGDWNTGWRGGADFRPQRGNNGHHRGQYKRDRDREENDRQDND